MNTSIKCGIGSVAVLALGALGIHHHLEKKKEEARVEAARQEAYDWESYFRKVCSPGLTPQSSDTSVSYCPEGKEREKILEISKGDGSYDNDAGTHRPRRHLFNPTIGIINVPKWVGGDAIGMYAALPTKRTPWLVKIIPTEDYRDVCYVVTHDSIDINGRSYETINLEGQLKYCLREEWRSEDCDVRYGAIVFVQKPEYCEYPSTFKEHIRNTPQEVSLVDWKKQNPWR